MADQNNAPERIWVRVTDKTVMYAKPSDADEFDVEYIRADRAAPTDNTALVEEMENLKDRNGKPPLTKEEMARFRELFPLDHLSRVALAAWVNVRPDQLPKEMQAHNCPATMEAWGRVAHAIEAALASREAPPACQQKAVTEALQDMLQAVCGDTGFAACVRQESGKAYPWPALDLAEAKALRALEGRK